MHPGYTQCIGFTTVLTIVWQLLSIRQRLRHPYAINENENRKNLNANMFIYAFNSNK